MGFEATDGFRAQLRHRAYARAPHRMLELREAELASDHTRIIYDPDLVTEPTPALFDPDHWRAADKLTGTAEGRGAAWFIDVPTPAGAGWVLRHYRRGGLPGKLIADRYLHWPTAKTRPWREFRIGAKLHAEGLPVPRPVAACLHRHGLLDSFDLITEAIPGAVSLADAAIAGTATQTDWHKVGKVIAQMHRAGVWHADLNARNLLLRNDGQWMIIDLDRARLRSGTGWQAGNLKRLRRSLAKITDKNPGMAFDDTCWAALAAGYEA